MRAIVSAVGVFIATAMFVPQAQAAYVVPFEFSGAGFKAIGHITVEKNVPPADPNPNCGTPGNNPCRTDPPGAYRIVAIKGAFSDATDGITNAPITGLVPISPTNERDPKFDPLVPSSLSYIDYPGGALTYNNLFFPNGSPIDCDFPFSGTFVDVFGMAFTVKGGYTADLWGDGNMNGPGTKTYGVGVTDGTQGLAYVFAGINATSGVPEPSSWTLMLIGFGALGLGVRRRRGRSQAARFSTFSRKSPMCLR
jgi:hypothetical protein